MITRLKKSYSLAILSRRSKHLFFSIVTDMLKTIVLYRIDGVPIAAQCAATFSRSIVLPRIYILLGREHVD